ncbi:EF-hand domain-containing protein [Streptomyces pini]|uniref:EF-hand domain pair n=1 Tax=Streptomyces pini TaxID=1520580 RepID=A0A1I3V1V3_9ACTN|nr:EF-hand domain-containing protein [Streptomyces pini]SFJ88913.1 EF-hand domain pair [Streptomyces pini]
MADMETAREAFDRFDLNGDGLVTAAEFRKVLGELGDHTLTVDMAQTLINQHDSDGDGLLSFEEFWQARQKTATRSA